MISDTWQATEIWDEPYWRMSQKPYALGKIETRNLIPTIISTL